MFKKVIVTNYLGKSIEYSFEGPTIDDESGLFITSIDGLGPVKADIRMTKLATADGKVYNSSSLDGRNIIIKGRFTYAKDIEEARLMSYKFFPIGKQVTFKIYTDNRIAQAVGYVESNQPNPFTNKSDVQISILCESSYFESADPTDNRVTTFSNVVEMFEFPFSNESPTDPLIEFGTIVYKKENTVYYEGDAETGCLIKLHAIGDVKMIKIVNVKTAQTLLIDTDKLGTLVSKRVSALPTANADNENQWVRLTTNNKTYTCVASESTPTTYSWVEIDPNRMIYGDTIEINTNKGQKSITLLRNGRSINILNVLGKNADWFQLARGDNLFAYVAEYGEANLQFTVETQIIYEGV